MSSRNRPFPFNIALFAIFPFVFLFSANTGDMSVTEILVPCLISILIAVIMVGAGFIVVRDLALAACCVALLQLLFFSYGHVYEFIREAFGAGLGRHRYVIGCYLVGAAGGFILLYRFRKGLGEVTKFLNIMSIALFILPAVSVASMVMGSSVENDAVGAGPDNPPQQVLKYSKSTPMPDVYYIILDGYTGAESLEHFFDFDNKEFVGFLREKGFQVVNNAHSNFVHTIDSLTSTLNMELANYDSAVGRKKMFFNNQVTKNFKALGYKYVHFASRLHEATRFASVDRSFDHGFFDRELGLMIRQTTALRLYFKMFEGERRKRVFSTFDNIASLTEDTDATFAFAHIMMPHPPYIVDRNGNAPPASTKLSMTHWEPKEMYLGQVIFLNKKIMELVDKLLIRSSHPPIIILQGDHGPKFKLAIDTDYAYQILNASYLPGLERSPFYETITPVNTFRVLFNEYFGGQYSLLEDRASLPDPLDSF
jgi:hypothetical protein